CKNAKHKEKWFSTVKTYALPVLGKKKLADIKKQDILEVLNPIWLTKNETASRVRGRLENIFSYAVSDGLMEFNPALWRGNLDRELPPPGKVQKTEHHEAMSLEELQGKIDCFYPAINRTRQVILFTILTASRVGESVPAKWDEIDWDNKVWSVPAERRKDGKPYPHRVPLSTQAVELLESIERTGEYIFSIKDTLGSRYSLAVLLKRMTGSQATMHGFRSTFRDWAAENGVPDIVAEKCLMHSTGSAVVQAYQRSDLLEQRREVMQRWADAVFAKFAG
ncbi:tyrosine-type recombinase/integrase, partial [Turicimonas muris]|uniref:tyrosine-type recombinase/integrase n=1 Tax=Turicimonas muris TaxID=1796652 RepID=UPI00262645AB